MLDRVKETLTQFNMIARGDLVVAVHQDKEHLHIHFVTNTVSYLDGYKLHTSKADMEKMKSFTNDMCKERGLTIAQKGKHFDGSSLDEGEVIAWDNNTYRLLIDETKKPFLVDCVLAFINVIKVAFDKDSFIDGMKKLGWNVVWSDKRKHITFVDEQGNKVRDTNLSKKFNVKISKEDILNECKRQNAGVGLSEEYGQLNRELEREVRGGKGSTANFLSGLMKSVPPLHDLFNQAGLDLPEYLAKKKAETADAEQIVEE